MKLRIQIDSSLSPSDIMATYNVSRTTAWRAIHRGWLCVDYHSPTLDYNEDSIIIVGYLIARQYNSLRTNLIRKFRMYNIPVQDVEDALGSAIIQTLERSQEYLNNNSSLGLVYYRAYNKLQTQIKNFNRE